MIYSVEDIKNKIRSCWEYLEQKFKVANLELFGSYAANNQTEESDLDFLVEFNEPVSLFTLIDLQNYLEDLFGKKVDLGTKSSLKEYVRENVLRQAIKI